MLHELSDQRRANCRRLAAVLLVTVTWVMFGPAVWAQPAPQDVAGPSAQGTESAAAGAPDDAAADTGASPAAPASLPSSFTGLQGISFFRLLVMGGWFMVPIVLMSLLGAVFAIERGLALRRSRLVPEELVGQLGQLSGGQTGFDPRQAYRICQQFPCAASSVIRAMLVKVGRPHNEIEHAVAEASDREADRAFANVRWLNLCAGVTPLMGLIGTVWDMIVAFHHTTLLAPGQDRATQLAEGIYIALVTTLGGLMVAIPASIVAHFFETRIINMFHEINELMFNLLPLVERFEGRVRFGPKQAEQANVPPAAGEPQAEPPAAGN